METGRISLSSFIFLILTIALAIFVVYRVFNRLKSAAGVRRALEIRADELGGFSYIQLVLISFVSLFVEMLMIRWVSSEIRIFAYFKNFVLVACFLGFGLGCYLCRRRIQLTALIAPFLLLTFILKASISPCAAASRLYLNCWEPALKFTSGACPLCQRVGRVCCLR